MRKILLGTTAVVGAALIGLGSAQAQSPSPNVIQSGPAGSNQAVQIPTGPSAPTVRIGGYLQTTFAWVQDDVDKAQGSPTGVNAAGNAARSHNDFRNEVEIHVFVNGKAANGLAYGAVVEIQNDNSGGSGAGSALDLDEAYVFLTSPTLGSIRFGEEDSAASLLQVRAPSITAFGPDGAWDVGILGNNNQTGGNPSLLTGVNDGSDATKIIYLSPQFYGIDFGLSYAANAGEGDRAFNGRAVDVIGALGSPISPTSTQRDYATLTNEYSAALRYRGSFQNVGIAASFVAMRADAQRNSLGGNAGTNSPVNSPTYSPSGSGYRPPNITAYSFGATVTAYGFSFGGEYTWGNYSGTSVGRGPLANNSDGSKRDASSHWVLGLTYTTGPWSVGAYYGQATQDNGDRLTLVSNGVSSTLLNPDDRQQTGWGIGMAYTLAPGLELFANYNSVEDKNVYIPPAASLATAASSNTLVSRNYEGILIGTRLAF